MRLILFIILLFLFLLIYFNKHSTKEKYTESVSTDYDTTDLYKELGIISDETYLFSDQVIDYNNCMDEYPGQNYCSDLLTANRNYTNEYGYATANINNKQRLFPLYKTVNEGTEEYIFYIQTDNKKYYVADVETGDKITYDGTEYTLYLFSDDVFIDIVDPYYKSYRYQYAKYDEDNGYDYSFGFLCGKLIDKNNQNNEFDLYRQVSQEEWNYYVGDGKTIVPLDGYNNIEDEDEVSTEFDNNTYITTMNS